MDRGDDYETPYCSSTFCTQASNQGTVAAHPVSRPRLAVHPLRRTNPKSRLPLSWTSFGQQSRGRPLPAVPVVKTCFAHQTAEQMRIRPLDIVEQRFQSDLKFCCWDVSTPRDTLCHTCATRLVCTLCVIHPQLILSALDRQMRKLDFIVKESRRGILSS